MAARVAEDPETLFWNLADPGTREGDISGRYVPQSAIKGGNL